MFTLILSSLYLFLPAYFANMCPVFASRLKLPFGKPISEKLFGSHKTYRGFLAGFIGALIILIIQKTIFDLGFLHSISLLDYKLLNLLPYALAMGIGALIGDVGKSFVKRRLKIAPGEAFIPFDQIDFIIASTVFLMPIYIMPLKIFIIALLITPILHLMANIVAYKLKLKEVWY